MEDLNAAIPRQKHVRFYSRPRAFMPALNYVRALSELYPNNIRVKTLGHWYMIYTLWPANRNLVPSLGAPPCPTQL